MNFRENSLSKESFVNGIHGKHGKVRDGIGNTNLDFREFRAFR